LISLSRTQLVGYALLVFATGIAVNEYQSSSHTLTTNTQDLIVAQKDTKDIPTDLNELAVQINSTNDTDEVAEKECVLQIASGNTFMSILSKIGMRKEDSLRVIESLKRVYDMRELKVGQDINLRYRKDGTSEVSLLALSFRASHAYEITLEANEEGSFIAKKYQIALHKVQKCIEGTIDSSFYAAALKRGVPAQVVREAINALAYDVNWQHDPTRGDPFTIVYDAYQDTNGNIVRADNLKYVAFVPRGKKQQAYKIYRFQPAKGAPGYYDVNGVSVVRALLQTPIDPSKMRLTSKFGRRAWHPLGYSTNHKGVDFGAAPGTPVKAAGDGVVVKAGHWGHYGNYIMIRHTSSISTAYAHLSRMKVKIGQTVRQNQLIGNVGSTGRTTGPHLHYEVIRNGVHINPLSVKQMPTNKLNARDLADFRRVKLQIEKEIAEIASSPSQMASADMPVRPS